MGWGSPGAGGPEGPGAAFGGERGGGGDGPYRGGGRGPFGGAGSGGPFGGERGGGDGGPFDGGPFGGPGGGGPFGERGGGGPGFFGRHRGHGGGGEDGFFGGHGGPFGVRRPLRFLAHKLDLSEAQVADLAKILDDLKTERAQAEVDLRRSIAAFADSIEGAAFGEDRAKEGGAERVKSAEHLRDAVVRALGKIHALLEADQRKQFAYLIRTGVVSM